MRGEQFYRSQKKELLLCRKGWTKTRAWKISLHSPFTRFLIESRRKKEEKFPRFPQKGTYPSPSSPPLPPPPSFKPKNNKAKVANEEYSILILFHPSFFRTKKTGVHVRGVGWWRSKGGNVHFRGNYTEASGQWHADTALSRVGTGARNWAMCRLARATTLYEHCGENIWFSRWPSATVKFRPHCFERRNVGRRGVGRGELVWFKSGRPPHDSSQS